MLQCLKKWVAKEGDRSCPLCRSNTLLPEEYPHLGCHWIWGVVYSRPAVFRGSPVSHPTCYSCKFLVITQFSLLFYWKRSFVF